MPCAAHFATLYRTALATLALLALAGCATMSKEECEATDWRTVGYEDGAMGQGIERLASRRQACAKHGVSLDLAAYRAGRDEGLLEFCQPANGFRAGTRGRDYSGACPAHLAADFEDAYRAGRELWRLESRVNDTLRSIADRYGELEDIDASLVAQSLVMVAEESTAEERAQALLDTRTMTERRGRLLTEIDALERALPTYEAELEDYRRELADFGY